MYYTTSMHIQKASGNEGPTKYTCNMTILFIHMTPTTRPYSWCFKRLCTSANKACTSRAARCYIFYMYTYRWSPTYSSAPFRLRDRSSYNSCACNSVRTLDRTHKFSHHTRAQVLITACYFHHTYLPSRYSSQIKRGQIARTSPVRTSVYMHAYVGTTRTYVRTYIRYTRTYTYVHAVVYVLHVSLMHTSMVGCCSAVVDACVLSGYVVRRHRIVVFTVDYVYATLFRFR